MKYMINKYIHVFFVQFWMKLHSEMAKLDSASPYFYVFLVNHVCLFL